MPLWLTSHRTESCRGGRPPSRERALILDFVALLMLHLAMLPVVSLLALRVARWVVLPVAMLSAWWA